MVRTLAIVAAIIPMMVAAPRRGPARFEFSARCGPRFPPGLFVSMDSMIGRDFETGFANLKTLAER
jgi:hypothetical protein